MYFMIQFVGNVHNRQIYRDIKKVSGWMPGWLSRLCIWTLYLVSDYDLTVCEFKPRVRLCADITEPAWDSLSPSLSALPLLSLSLSLCLSK